MSKEEFLKKARDMDRDVGYDFIKGTRANAIPENSSSDDKSATNPGTVTEDGLKNKT